MSETPESLIPSAPAPQPASAAPPSQPDRLFQAAAWVAIVAGILFIAATILSFIGVFVWCR